jgi:hypothetical protein
MGFQVGTTLGGSDVVKEGVIDPKFESGKYTFGADRDQVVLYFSMAGSELT